MKNCILIGMPGVGKSTVGVVLAKRMGYQFVDSDLVIQDRYGSLLHVLIEEKGVDGFLHIENEVNASLQVKNCIIATGGSVIYGKEAMQHLKKLGTVVYLQLSYDAVVGRLGDLHQRGVVQKEGQELYDIFKERVPYYEQYADITVDCDDKSIREIVEEITRNRRVGIGR